MLELKLRNSKESITINKNEILNYLNKWDVYERL
jgi:hypothetical protein